ncbi:MAG: 30S ribosomal protein S20 [Endomicrobiales bacterium]
MAKLKTGRHTSALKEARKAIKREERNQSQESRIKTLAGKVESAVASKDKKLAQDLLKTAFSEWDRAAKKNVIHVNAANNQKARLAKLVSSLQG